MVPVPYTRDDARTYLRHIIPGGWETDREWGFVVEADDDAGVPRFAGTISLRNMDERPRRDRLRLAPMGPWSRRDGAGRCGCCWTGASPERDLHTVHAGWPAAGNWASRRLAWRLGFSVEGTLRDWLPQRGGLVDTWVGDAAPGRGRCHPHSRAGCRLRGSPVTPWCSRANAEADIPRTGRGAQRRARCGGTAADPPGAAPHDEATARERSARASSRRAARGATGDVDGGRPGDRRAARLGGAATASRRTRGRGGLLGAPRRSRARCCPRGLQDGRPARVRRHRGRRAGPAPGQGVRRDGEPRVLPRPRASGLHPLRGRTRQHPAARRRLRRHRRLRPTGRPTCRVVRRCRVAEASRTSRPAKERAAPTQAVEV